VTGGIYLFETGWIIPVVIHLAVKLIGTFTWWLDWMDLCSWRCWMDYLPGGETGWTIHLVERLVALFIWWRGWLDHSSGGEAGWIYLVERLAGSIWWRGWLDLSGGECLYHSTICWRLVGSIVWWRG
jgi:hypothetical protein